MKPSDLKKKKPVIIPKDEGYSSDEEKNFADNYTSSLSEVYKDNFADLSNQTADQNLLSQITSLKKQLQLYKDFRESDLKIKEGYKENIKNLQEENKLLKEKISQLENQTKPTENPQPQEVKTFLCSDCQQSKPQAELSRVFNNFSFCLACSKQARKQAQQEKEPQEFICHSCEQTKQEIPVKMKLDSTLTKYLVCSTCRPTLKEFNEADLITDDLWEKYPYSSASEILEKEFGIKKEEAW